MSTVQTPESVLADALRQLLLRVERLEKLMLDLVNRYNSHQHEESNNDMTAGPDEEVYAPNMMRSLYEETEQHDWRYDDNWPGE